MKKFTCLATAALLCSQSWAGLGADLESVRSDRLAWDASLSQSALSGATLHSLLLPNGVPLSHSIMDSGSNGLFFGNAALPTCGGALTDFYCPSSTSNLSASIQLASGTTNVAFSIASANTLLTANSYFAFNNLGGTLDSTTFDWGLPFFFGRSVFTVIKNRSVPGTSLTGPFNAFTN